MISRSRRAAVCITVALTVMASAVVSAAETEGRARAGDLAPAFWGGARPAPAGKKIVQIGPTPAPFARPFANPMRETTATKLRAAFSGPGKAPRIDGTTLIAAGHIDANGRVLSMPPAPDGVEGRYYIERFPAFIASTVDGPGTYELTWEGDPAAEIGLIGSTAGVRVDKSPGKWTFDVPAGRKVGLWPTVIDPGDVARHGGLAFAARKVGAEEDKGVLVPRVAEEIARYDVVRWLDQSSISSLGHTSADQLTARDDPYWGSGWPFRTLVRATVEADAAGWFFLPSETGSTPAIQAEVRAAGPQSARVATTAKYARDILASDEWEKMAGALVAALDAEAYPTGRIAFVELGNEIWNFAAAAFATGSEHYWGFSQALADRDGEKGGPRFGYGYAVARAALAMERAVKASANPNREWRIVLGAQTGWPDQMKPALSGLDAGLAAIGRPDLKSRIGVAGTSYYRSAFAPYGWQGSPRFYKDLAPDDAKGAVDRMLAEADADFDGFAKRIADFMIAEGVPLSIRLLQQVRDLSEAGGVAFIGDYEGGNHDTVFANGHRGAEMTALLERYLATEHAARVQAAMNDAHARVFPEAMLANYAGRYVAPTRGSPWTDGPYKDVGLGDEWPIARVWDEVAGRKKGR